MKHWVNKYIGVPFIMGGESRETGLDCWGLFRLIQKEQFGRDMPIIDLKEYNPHVISELYAKHWERENWSETRAPVEGDGVLMRMAKHPIHVGIFVASDGVNGIVHTTESFGCVFTPQDQLRFNSWKVEGYYRHGK